MSLVHIRAALEARLEALSAGFETAVENFSFTPSANTAPYQRINMLPVEPDNSNASSSYYERGIFQITLCYPIETGPGAVEAKADAVRTYFKRGTTMTTSGGATVNVTKTPKISSGYRDGDRWCIPVSVQWHTYVT